MIMKPVSVVLNDVLLTDDKYLPLCQSDNNKLLALIPDGESMYLTIQDNLYTEWVLVENQCGTLVLHRGEGGSTARKFPRGSCVFFETSLPLIKWLICNYDCCADGDCTCTGVEEERAILPTALVNNEWEGRILFNGSLPINIAVDGMPSWMSAEYMGDTLRLYGTPTATGTFIISVSASNCSGSTTIAKQHTVTVARPAE